MVRFHTANIAVHIMVMIVVMGINRNIFRKLIAEKVNKRWIV